MIAGQFSQPILRMSQLFQDFQLVRVSVERLGDILNTAPEPVPQNLPSLPPAKARYEGKMTKIYATFETLRGCATEKRKYILRFYKWGKIRPSRTSKFSGNKMFFAAGLLCGITSAAMAEPCQQGSMTRHAECPFLSIYSVTSSSQNQASVWRQRLYETPDTKHVIRDVSTEEVAVVNVSVGEFTLHVPKNYLDASDGFQGKFGCIKIRALLPCLAAENSSNTGEFHLNHWDKILVARLSVWDVHNLTGAPLLAARISQDRSVDHLRKDLKSPEENEELPGTGFHLYKGYISGLDIFTRDGSDPLFVLECSRRDNYARFPWCSSRTVIGGSLLLEYEYSRTYIDNSLQNSLVIDKNIQELFRIFLSPKPELVSLEKGVCQ